MTFGEPEFFRLGVGLGLLYGYVLYRQFGATPEQIQKLNDLEKDIDTLRDRVLEGSLTNNFLIDERLTILKDQIQAVFQ
jgi:hypothetical protein